MDEIDRSIIHHLRSDGRLSVVELADRVGLSPSPTLRRVRSLERTGVIRGYRAEIDPVAEGRSFEVFVTATLATTDPENVTAFEDGVAEIDEVRACYRMFGDTDYLVLVAVEDLAAYERLWSERLSRLRGAARVSSQIAMKVVKRE